MALESLDTEKIKKEERREEERRKQKVKCSSQVHFFPGPLKAATEGVHLAQPQ